jgi:proteasome-associated ATPase
MSATIVPMFLSEMDGFDDAGCFVILATNRPDDLDSAVVREGRIDRKIRIARPDESAAAETFRVHLRGKPSAVDPAWCAAELYAQHRILYQLTYKSDRSGSVVLGDLMSGAAIATLVDRACEVAIARDVASRRRVNASGLTQADVTAAIDQMEREYRTANHIDDLIRIVEEAGEPVAAVRKASKDGTFSTVALSNDGPKKHEALN